MAEENTSSVSLFNTTSNTTDSQYKSLLYDTANTLGLLPNTNSNDNMTKALGNIVDSGQLGLGPRILNIDGSVPIVQNKCTVVVLSTPKMWTKKWGDLGVLWKSLVETHLKSLSGIAVEYTLDKQEVIIGQDTQSLGMPTVSGRSPITPSFTWNEVYGNLIFRLHKRWISDIMHPDTHVSQLGSLLDDPDSLPGWFFSTFSASICVIQQDPLGLPNRIYDAVVINNLFPSTSGSMEFNVEQNSATVPDRSISYNGHLTHNDQTFELGRLLMETMQIHKPNYNNALVYRPSEGMISSDIASHGLVKATKEAVDYFTFNGVQTATNTVSNIASQISSQYS